jgi:outer membrane receptor protein involved in Fe transport
MVSGRNVPPTATLSCTRHPDPRGPVRRWPSFWRRIASGFILAGLGSALVPPLAAADAARKRFVLPEATAARALDAFSAQSKTQLIYRPDQIRGIRTTAVEGDFTDREALERMLAGTPLHVMQDARTGTLAIFTDPPDPVARPEPPGRPDSGLVSALRALPGKLFSRPGAPAAVGAGSETVRMNPFEVVDVKDGGFQASSVGSGSRLALDLRDTPAAYSVVNREFIDALGITDLAEAASWATGQTFYFSDNGGDALGRPSQYFARGALTSQGGADSFGAQRNFYQNANQGGDSYAVETYDFGRSPNAPLFGQGSGVGGDSGNGGLGGVSSIQSKRAHLDRNRTVLTVEAGQWDYRRATLDWNRPLHERLGVRLNAVDLSQGGWRDLDMRRTRGLTVTGTYLPTRTTEIRVEASTERNESHTVGAGWDEYISGWDGHTVFRGPITNAMISPDAAPGALAVANASYGTLRLLGSASGLTFGGAPNGVQRLGPSFFYDPYAATVMNYQNMGVSRRADDTSRTPLWSRTAPNGAFFVRGTNQNPVAPNLGTDVAFGVGRSLHMKQGLPSDLWYQAEENSRFRVPSQRFESSVRVPTSQQTSRDLQFTLSQRLAPRLFAELGGDVNRNQTTTRGFDNPSGPAGGGRTATLDLNQLRPDGSPNPGFLDVFSALGLGRRVDSTQDQTLRANLAYVADSGRWGSYAFNLNGNLAQRNFKTLSHAVSLRTNADSRLWGGEQLRSLVYWSDRVRSYHEPVGGATVTFTNVDWTNGDNPVVAVPVKATPAWVLTAASETFFQSRYALLQTTAKWFRDRLVLVGAVRRDLSVGRTKRMVANGDLPAGWDGATVLYRPDAPADYFTMTYVPKDPVTGVPVNGKPVLASVARPRLPAATGGGLALRNPVFAGDRFREDYNNPGARFYDNTRSVGFVWHAGAAFSPYANFSNTFTPASATSLDLNGDPRRPIKANGRDLGFNLSLLGNRINAKYNYYTNVRQNDVFTPPTSTAINALYQANAFNDPDATISGRNARGAADLPGADYTGQRNWGYEIEVAASLLPEWRLALNGSAGSYAIRNAAPLTRAYVPAQAALFRQILEDAGGSLDPTQRPAGAPSAPGLAVAIPVPGRATGLDTTSAVNAYNNVWLAYDSLLGARSLRTPRQPTINFFTDYSFQTGRAKGLRIGAGIQWQGRVALTTMEQSTILDPSNPVPTAIDDPRYNQYDFRFMKGSYLTQANIAYNFRLKDGSRLGLALRINNIVNDRRMVVGDGAVGGGVSGTGTGGVAVGVGFGAAQMRPASGNPALPSRVALPDQVSRFSEPINFRLSATYEFGRNRDR